MIEDGAFVFFECPQRSWILGHVVKWDGKKGSCKSQAGDVIDGLVEDQITIARDDTVDEDKNDLMDLTVLHDATILRCLQIRYMRDVIYTNIGPIVVALNPFNFKIPWYTDDNMPKYLSEGDRIENNLPHSWAVAHNTYFEMINDQRDQCILVSGESGAGKTEASKIVMKYLAAVSTKMGSEAQKEAGLGVGKKINITSPPLETWGNAKTVRNDNSSRFGKFMKVRFDGDGLLTGAFMIKYLLEKSRIVTAGPGERCYHSFYLCLRGQDAPQYSLGSDSEYKSVTSGKCVNNKEFDTAEEYQEVKAALLEIGVSPDNVFSMWAVVAGVLHMQNVEFDADGEGSRLRASTEKDLEKGVGCWKVDKSVLQKELCITTLCIQGQDVEKLLNPVKAADCRDSLSKHLYDNEFSNLIETCNTMLDTGGSSNWIGLLDIFGFEDFEVNSFEQLCINLANESLQHHYNTYIFQRDMDECRAEGIDVTSVVFPDNTPCLQMVSAKGGIMALLDEECALGKGSDQGFLDKVIENHSSNPFFAVKKLSKDSFIIRHYAKDVNYTIDGFLEKNRDTLKDAFKEMMRASADSYIAGLLPAPDPDAKGPRVTVGGFYKSQLRDLMDLINSTNPHWIRCIKPHPAKKPLMFDGLSTYNQLSSAGVIGTVRIRKAGFPVRIVFEEFFYKYRVVGGKDATGSDFKGSASKILAVAGLDKKELAQLGKTRVFMKAEAYIALEKVKKDMLQGSAQTVQAWCRGLVALSSVRKQILDKSKDILDKLREEYRAALAERKQKEAEEKARLEAERAAQEAAMADQLAREKAEREARELAERMAQASAGMCAEEEQNRAAIAAEEDETFASLLHAEVAERRDLINRLEREQVEWEEATARASIAREEEEDAFKFTSLIDDLRHRSQLEIMRREAEVMLQHHRQERQEREDRRKELLKHKDRTLPERLAVPNVVVNQQAIREHLHAEELRARALLGDQLGVAVHEAAEDIPTLSLSRPGSPAGSSSAGSPAPSGGNILLQTIPAGQSLPGSPHHTGPLDVWSSPPTTIAPGCHVFVHATNRVGVVVSLEPGRGEQFRVQFADDTFLWCDLSDVSEVTESRNNVTSPELRAPSITSLTLLDIGKSPIQSPTTRHPGLSPARSPLSWGSTGRLSPGFDMTRVGQAESSTRGSPFAFPPDSTTRFGAESASRGSPFGFPDGRGSPMSEGSRSRFGAR